jgi:hypothetical protein
MQKNYLHYMCNLCIYIIYSFPFTVDKYRFLKWLNQKRYSFHPQLSHALFLDFSYSTNIRCIHGYIKHIHFNQTVKNNIIKGQNEYLALLLLLLLLLLLQTARTSLPSELIVLLPLLIAIFEAYLPAEFFV